jgi:tetratricopeptide (TPR) repeat protein
LRRAYEVCQQTEDDAHVFELTWNLWLHHQVGGDYERASELADEVVHLADLNGDEELVLEAHHAAWTTALNQGRLTDTHDHCAEGISLYSPEKYHECTFTYGGHDAGVCGLAHDGIALAALGHPEKALRRGQQAVALADQLGHGPSITSANALHNLILLILREPEELMEASEQCMAAAERYGPPHFRAFGQVGHGWALAAGGNIVDGIRYAEAAVSQYKNTGAIVRLPVALMALADIHRTAGELAAAEATIDEGLDLIANNADKTCWADMIRLKAEILHEQSGEAGEVEALYREAIAIADKQQANLFELRASTGLATMLLEQGRDAEARKLLISSCNRFPEKDAFPDLERARSILQASGPT